MGDVSIIVKHSTKTCPRSTPQLLVLLRLPLSSCGATHSQDQWGRLSAHVFMYIWLVHSNRSHPPTSIQVSGGWIKIRIWISDIEGIWKRQTIGTWDEMRRNESPLVIYLSILLSLHLSLAICPGDCFSHVSYLSSVVDLFPLFIVAATQWCNKEERSSQTNMCAIILLVIGTESIGIGFN